MTTSRIAIVTTTIFPIDIFLERYYINIFKYSHEKYVKIYIAGDRKSPAGCVEIATHYKNKGLDVVFLTIEKQIEYLNKYPDLKDRIPENSDNRRNVSFLMALEEGAEIIISVDDDNFPIDEIDFISGHKSVGNKAQYNEAIGHNNWFNICSMLNSKSSPSDLLYARGFPYKRRSQLTHSTGDITQGTIAVNVGLWTGDPDVDAISRLSLNPVIVGWQNENLILGKDVRTPINTQNTAISREAMIAYYYVKMGHNLKGMKIDRFGDIFSGYFLQVCVDAMGGRIKIGSPIVQHTRNNHNLLYDLYNELAGIMILEEMEEFLTSVKLNNNSYYDSYVDLTRKLDTYIETKRGFIWDDQTSLFFFETTKTMRLWADIVKQMG